VAINRVEKLIINLDTCMPLTCAWDECTNRARTSHQVRVHEHEGRCGSEQAQYGRHVIYAFCSDRHLAYWTYSSGRHAHDAAARNQGRIYGQLPPGMKRTIL
jgi:hypothetical protein